VPSLAQLYKCDGKKRKSGELAIESEPIGESPRRWKEENTYKRPPRDAQKFQEESGRQKEFVECLVLTRDRKPEVKGRH
jgi:hypothetical protein